VLLFWTGYRLRIRQLRAKFDLILAERGRIARELHDTLIQGFAGITMSMQALASRVAHWITWPAVVVLTILCIFGRPILRLFGADFVDAYPSMVILGFGQLVNAASGSVGYLLGLTGHQKESMRVIGWAALTNIVFNLVGITLLGLTGASIGTAVSMALWNLWLYRLVVRYVKVRPSLFDPQARL